MEGGDSVATKSRREAERRRRQRINAHLATLRSLLPNTTKMDKASLLAEVVEHLKDLRKRAADVALRDWGTEACENRAGLSRAFTVVVENRPLASLGLQHSKRAKMCGSDD